MKKILSLVLSLVVLVGCLSVAFADEKVTLVTSRWSGDHADVQKELLADYADATVKVDDIDYSNLKSKQIQSLSVSGDYDLVWVAEVWMPEYVSNGWLLPLDEYIEKYNIDMSQYSEGMVSGNTFDGKLYGMPDYAQTLILAYNAEWFEQENIEVPTTMEEVIEVAKYFKEKGTGIAIPATQGTWSNDIYAQLLYSAGGDYFDENGNIDMTSETAIYAAQTFKALCDYSITGSLTWAHEQVAEAVRTKIAPFGLCLTGNCAAFHDPEQSMVTDTIAYAPLPGPDGEAAGVAMTWTWAVAANSKNPDEAFKLAAHITSPEVEKQMTIRTGQVSAVSALSEDEEAVAAVAWLPAASNTLAKGKTQPTDQSAQGLFDPLAATLSEIAVSDAKKIPDLMAALQEQVKDISIAK